MNDNVFRLAQPKKKGFLHLLFSRFLVIALLILLQLLLILGVYFWLNDVIKWISIIYLVFEIAMVIYLFNNRMDSAAKLTWLFVIAIFPFIGAVFLWFTQTNFGNQRLKGEVLSLIHDSMTALEQPEDALQELQNDHSGTGALAKYLTRDGCFPVYRNTEVTFFPCGEDKFAAVLEELKKAESFIYMEYFIIEEGYMWGEILRILIEKAQAGVDVRVMYDGMCEISQLPADYWKLLEKQGIRAKAFSPIRPVISSHYNYRDHRKILVIDGKVAFNGGVNLADEYINRIERFGHWKDTAVMLRGEAVESFTLMFLQMWYVYTHNEEPSVQMLKDLEECKHVAAGYSVAAPGFVMPYADCPLDLDKTGEVVYMDILNRAERYVHIMTPYLILDGELETAIKTAAERGVDVRIILPGIPDKKPAYALAKTHYQSLLDAGVKVYEYTPGFVHAKIFVCDNIKAVVGTINLDYRSLYHHFECATYLYKVPCIAQIEYDFRETWKKCRRVTYSSIKHEKLSYKIGGSLMKFLAPLM